MIPNVIHTWQTAEPGALVRIQMPTLELEVDEAYGWKIFEVTGAWC